MKAPVDPAAQCREMLARNEPLEEVLRCLRKSGIGKGGTIRVLVEAAGYSLRHAKQAVHESEVWADVKARDETFQDELLEKLSDDPEGTSR